MFCQLFCRNMMYWWKIERRWRCRNEGNAWNGGLTKTQSRGKLDSTWSTHFRCSYDWLICESWDFSLRKQLKSCWAPTFLSHLLDQDQGGLPQLRIRGRLQSCCVGLRNWEISIALKNEIWIKLQKIPAQMCQESPHLFWKSDICWTIPSIVSKTNFGWMTLFPMQLLQILWFSKHYIICLVKIGRCALAALQAQAPRTEISRTCRA